MKQKLCICMGSSCFARGNERNLELIEQYIAQHHAEDQFELSGSRCEGTCIAGPNIRVNDTLHSHIDSGSLLDMLEEVTQSKDQIGTDSSSSRER